MVLADAYSGSLGKALRGVNGMREGGMSTATFFSKIYKILILKELRARGLPANS
jgi:hypothetical protein